MAGNHSLPLFSGPRRTRANIAHSCRPLCCACKPGTGVSDDCGLTRDSYFTLGHFINLDTPYFHYFCEIFSCFCLLFGVSFLWFDKVLVFPFGHVYLDTRYFTIFVSSLRVFIFRFWSLFISSASICNPPATVQEPHLTGPGEGVALCGVVVTLAALAHPCIQLVAFSSPPWCATLENESIKVIERQHHN